MIRTSLLLSILATAATMLVVTPAAHSQGYGMIPGPSDSSVLPFAIGGVINNPLMTGTELGGGGYGGPGGCGGGYGGPGGYGGSGYGGNYGGPGGYGGGGYGGNYGGPGGCGGGYQNGGYGGNQGGAYTGNYNYVPNPGTNGSYMTTGSTGSYLSNPYWSSTGTASNGGTMSTSNNGGYGTLFNNVQNNSTGNIFYPNGTYTGSTQTSQSSGGGTGLGNGVQNGSSSSSSKTGYMLPFAPLPTSGNPTPQASKFAGTSETSYQSQSYSRQPYNVTGATE